MAGIRTIMATLPLVWNAATASSYPQEKPVDKPSSFEQYLEGKMKPLCAVFIRGGIGPGWLTAFNIPQEGREVEAYTGGSATLDEQTSGMLGSVSYGVGFDYKGKYQVGIDARLGSSGDGGGRGTWSEQGFPPRDEYAGYVYRLDNVTFSLAKSITQGIYLKGGFVYEKSQILSGADAYSTFHPQKRMFISNGGQAAVSASTILLEDRYFPFFFDIEAGTFFSFVKGPYPSFTHLYGEIKVNVAPLMFHTVNKQ